VRESLAGAGRTKLRHQEGNILIVPSPRGHYPQGAIDRLVDEARHLGLVSQREAGVDVRLQRELADQRQAERVDGVDGNIRHPIPQRQPAPSILGRCNRGRLQLMHDALAHLGRRLAREGDGENVRGIDACSQQVDVPRHEDRRLAGAG
jgi:hypothetical protein